MAAYGEGIFGEAILAESSGGPTPVTENGIVITLPFPSQDVEVIVPNLGAFATVMPSFTADIEANDPYNRVIMFFPLFTLDVEAQLRDSTVDITFPALEIDVEMDPNEVPDFDLLVRAYDPAVWWRFEAGDVREALDGDPDFDGFTRMVDGSGHGYDAALDTSNGPYSFPDGMVVDSLDSSFQGDMSTIYTGARAIAFQRYADWDHSVDPPSYLSSQKISVFVLAGYGGGYSSNRREVFGRQGLWYLAKRYGQWYITLSTYSYPYTYELGFGEDDETVHVDSIGFTAEPAADIYGEPYTSLQRYLNGVPVDDPWVFYHARMGSNDPYGENDNPNIGLDVGYYGPWYGQVQHALYFKRALGAGEFSALHQAAFASRPKTNKVFAVLPSLEVDVEATVPITGEVELDLPSMRVDMFSYTGNRTPMGGQDWEHAAPLQRGLMSAPSPRLSYMLPGDPINPYYSAWFKWTADTDKQVWFSTIRSLPEPDVDYMDTVMVGYLLADGVLHDFIYSDDVENFSTSQLVFDNPVIGETYYIRVGTYDDSGDGVGAYVIDNDLVPVPALADLIVIGGYQSPAGYVGSDGLTSGLTPTALTNSVSAPTSIPPGVQAWWLWTAEYTGTVSFDALLSQQWLTNGTGTEGPAVDITLWTDGDFLAYSESHGTVDYVVQQGQITFDVNAGQTYHIKLHSKSTNIGPVNGLIRISSIAVGSIVVPDPKTFIVDATPLSRYQVATNYGFSSETDPGFKYVSEAASPPILTNQAAAVEADGGFQGAYHLSRSFAGLGPQFDYNGALRCMWAQARTGDRGGQWWSRYGDGSGSGVSPELSYTWNGTDPYDGSKLGYGTCRSPWYAQASRSTSSLLFGTAGSFYYSTASDFGFFYYADAYMDSHGSQFRMSLTDTVKAIRHRSDTRDDAMLVSIGVMADTPVAKMEGYLRWYGNITPPVGYESNPNAITWGPGESGWWSAGSSDAEVGQWMSHPIVNGIPPAFAGGYYDLSRGGAPVGEYTNATVAEENLNNIFVPYSSQDQYWTPLDPYLLNGALAYEANAANLGRGGLTLAYLDPHLDSFEPPSKFYEAFGIESASSGLQTYAHRLLMKIVVQEPAYAGTGQPLGADGTGFPGVRDFVIGSLPPFPDFPPFDPGDITEQILFGPYPIEFTPAVDVLVFGPRHKSISWPGMQLAFDFDTELRTHDPVPDTDPLAPPVSSVRFQLPEFTLLDGVPVASKAVGRIAFTSETTPPHLSTQLYSIAHAVDLGETTRLSPFYANHQLSTSSYRRQPTDPVEYRTTEEVISLPDAKGSHGLYSAGYLITGDTRPGPERVSSYAYWRGNPAATTAISFRPNSLGEESLSTGGNAWFTSDEITILISAVLNDNAVTGALSPLFITQAPDGTPGVGLFFNHSSELLWWDYRHDIANPEKRVIGSLQLLDDIRRVSQPVLVGARINNVTNKVTLVAADSRLRTVETSMVAAIPSDHVLLVGDAGPLTSPGAFDMLDMRWWDKVMTDPELLSASAAMADLWGVML